MISANSLGGVLGGFYLPVLFGQTQIILTEDRVVN